MKKGIPQLDAIRGIAAATVAVWHWFSMARIQEPWFQDLNAFWYRGSEIAVTTFFVLSGTVLTLSICRNGNLPGYFLRRVLRIAPLLIAVVSASFAGMWLMRYGLGIDAPWSRYSDFSLWRGMQSILLLDTHFNPPGWTLVYEVAAYLLLPFLVLAIVRKGSQRAVSAALFLGLVGLVCSFWMTPEIFGRLMPMFLPGVALGLLLPYFRAPAPLMTAGGAALVVLVQFEQNHYDMAFLVATACALLIAGGTTLPRLANPQLRWLGDISYGVYLWHYPILWALFYLLGTFVGTTSLWLWLVAGAIGLPLTLLVSHLSYRYLEKPAMGLASKRSVGRKIPSRTVVDDFAPSAGGERLQRASADV